MANRMNQGSAVTVLRSDHLLTEILLKLPQKSVFRCQCVSRRWKDIISDPYFRCRYISQPKSSLLPLLGFFHGTTILRSKIPQELWAPPLSFLSTCEEAKSMSSYNFMKKVGFFVGGGGGGGSSGGLILCGLHPVNYYVCNPITNQWLKLPKSSLGDQGCAIGFCSEGCDDDGTIHFKVIRLCLPTDNVLPIETFSSRTGEWKESMLTCLSTKVLPLPQPFAICNVVGGVFHWKAFGEVDVDFIISYDPNMGKNQIWLTRLPNDIWPGIIRAVGQSPDGRLQCALCDSYGFTVWVLTKKLHDYSFSNLINSNQWILRHSVKYKDVPVNHPENMNLQVLGDNLREHPLVIAFHPQDSRLVYLQVGTRIFCYNLVTQRVEQVDYEGKAHPPCYNDFFPYFQHAWPGSLPHIGTRSSWTEKFIGRRRARKRKDLTRHQRCLLN